MVQTPPSTQILPAVAVAIFNEKGEILLQRRTDVGKWCVISGHVEFGETIEEAALREILEETNTKASLVRFIGVYSSPVSQTYVYEDKTIQYVTSYFEARLHDQLPVDYSNAKTHELRYFSPDTLPTDLAPMSDYWLADALSHESKVFLR